LQECHKQGMALQEGDKVGGMTVAPPGALYISQSRMGATQVDQFSEHKKPLVFQAFNAGKMGMEEVAPRGPENPAPLLVPGTAGPAKPVVVPFKEPSKQEIITILPETPGNLPLTPPSTPIIPGYQPAPAPVAPQTEKLIFITEVGDIPSECYDVYINEELKFITVSMPLNHGYIPKPNLEFTLEFGAKQWPCWSAGLVQKIPKFNLAVAMFAIVLPEPDQTVV